MNLTNDSESKNQIEFRLKKFWDGGHFYFRMSLSNSIFVSLLSSFPKAGYTLIVFCGHFEVILRKTMQTRKLELNDLYTILVFRTIFSLPRQNFTKFFWRFVQKPSFFAKQHKKWTVKKVFHEPRETHLILGCGRFAISV